MKGLSVSWRCLECDAQNLTPLDTSDSSTSVMRITLPMKLECRQCGTKFDAAKIIEEMRHGDE